MAVLSIDHRFRTEGHRHIKIPAHLHTMKIGLGDTDDRKRMPTNRKLLPDCIYPPAVFLLPVGIAQNCSGSRAPRLIVRGVQQAAQGGLNTQRFEEFTADPQSLYVVNFSRGRNVELIWCPGKHPRKTLLLVANLLP